MADISSIKTAWELQRIATSAKYRLTGSVGLCESASSYTLYKYAVTPGDILYLSLSEIIISNVSQPVYQWQNTSSDVPTSDTNTNLVGTPVTGVVSGYVEVPETATFLIVSQLTATTTFKVCGTVPISEDISKITLPDESLYDIKDKLGRQLIPFGTTDFDSTSTDFKATVEGVTELRSGVTCYIMNTKVTSASDCTLNVNGLGAKPIYSPTAAASRVTTGFVINYTWMFVYNEQRVSGGCWDMVTLYNSNTTYSSFSILVHGNAMYKVKSALYRYQLMFQMDDEYVTPLNNVSNSTKTNKTMLTNVEFDPFGEIFYYKTTTAIDADARPAAGDSCFTHNAVDLRYTFNCGSTLTEFEPIYLVVSPQNNGKVRIATPAWSQTLPSTNDGYWYIFLGRTYSTYQMALYPDHPIYKHDGTSLIQVLNPKIPIPKIASDVGAIAEPSSPNVGDVLGYDGSAWTNVTPTASMIGAIEAPPSPQDEQILYYSSANSQWVSTDLNLMLNTVLAQAYEITENNGTYHIDLDFNDIVSLFLSERKLIFYQQISTGVLSFIISYADLNTGQLILDTFGGLYQNYQLNFMPNLNDGGMDGTLITVKTGYGKIDEPASANYGDVLTYASGTGWTAAAPVEELPSVTSSDNGKVLRVTNGAWAAVQLPSASGVSF